MQMTARYKIQNTAMETPCSLQKRNWRIGIALIKYTGFFDGEYSKARDTYLTTQTMHA